jgi:hypothetical protein
MTLAMGRWPLLAVLSVTACTDWGALYRRGNDAVAAAPPEIAADAPPPAPDVEAAADAAPPDAAAAVARCDDPPTAPVVIWRFEGRGRPSPTQFIPDSACRPPDVPLSWDFLRSLGNTTMADRALFLDGAFLYATRNDSDDLGRAVTHARSFAIELWLRARRMATGTIFTTNTEKDLGRAFTISQHDAELRFAVHTTATDANGDRLLGAAGGTAEVTVPLPVDTPTAIHVVAMYSSTERAAEVYVNGVRAGAVPQAVPPVQPIPVWATMGRNQLGLGGAFDGDAWHGWLHRVAVYDRALTAQEIAALATQPP